MIRKITMSIDDETLAKAEEKAESLDTSVNDIITEYLRVWATSGDAVQAQQAMKERFAQVNWQFTVGTADTRAQRNARS